MSVREWCTGHSSVVHRGCGRLHSVLEDGRCAGAAAVHGWRDGAGVVPHRRRRCDAAPAGLTRVLVVAVGGRRGGRSLRRAGQAAHVVGRRGQSAGRADGGRLVTAAAVEARAGWRRRAFGRQVVHVARLRRCHEALIRGVNASGVLRRTCGTKQPHESPLQTKHWPTTENAMGLTGQHTLVF